MIGRLGAQVRYFQAHPGRASLRLEPGQLAEAGLEVREVVIDEIVDLHAASIDRLEGDVCGIRFH